jgi:iron complex outermembrane recepter protein
MKQIVFMLWAATGLYAQSAQVSGFVEDPSSSAVPKARISISNQDTSAERKTTTNEAGLYTIPLLPPGKYVMIVEAEGFETQKREGISLEVAQNARIDFHLAVGTTQQEVSRATPR